MSEWKTCVCLQNPSATWLLLFPILGNYKFQHSNITPTILNLDSTDQTQMLKTSRDKSSNIRSWEGQFVHLLRIRKSQEQYLTYAHLNELSTYMSHEIAKYTKLEKIIFKSTESLWVKKLQIPILLHIYTWVLLQLLLKSSWKVATPSNPFWC